MQTPFERWKRAVNDRMIQLSGLGADDIDDWDYRTAYENGVPPVDAAIDALENAGWDADEDLIDEP